MDSGLVATQGFPHAAASPAQARIFVRTTLRAWRLDRLEDTAVLLVSELATNVVLHARTGFDVRLERRGPLVRLSVLDDATSGPIRRRTRLQAATGRGLLLVDTLSCEWGRTSVRALGGRAKGIWCDLPTDEPAVDTTEGAIYGIDWLAQLEG